MPNYRNKNRNRNKNKQRNKQQQQQHQKQQQPQEKQKEEAYKEEFEVPSTASSPVPANTIVQESKTSPHPTVDELVTNASAICSDKNVADANASADDKSKELDVSKKVQSLKIIQDVTSATTATETKPNTTATNDTVLIETSHCDDNKIENTNRIDTNDNMGNEKSKFVDNQNESTSAQCVEVLNNTNPTTTTTIPSSPTVLGKVIVHRIICEDSNSETTNTKRLVLNESQKDLSESPGEENENAINIITQEMLHKEKELNRDQYKVIVHKIAKPDDDDVKVSQEAMEFMAQEVELPNEDYENQDCNNQSANEMLTSDKQSHQLEAKVITHEVDLSFDDFKKQEEKKKSPNEHEVKVVVHKVSMQEYDSEKPENSNTFSNNNDKDKNNYKTQQVALNTHLTSDDNEKVCLDNIQPSEQHQAKVIVHQIYLDDKHEEPNITSPTLREPIATTVKPTTSAVSIVEISDESLSDLEELKSPVISEAESSAEYSDDTQKVSDSITEVSSSSSSATTSIQKQSRKQKRIALEHHFLPQMLNPRFLDSISEENSEFSDNSENPLSRSASTDSATNGPNEGKAKTLNAKYPKSSLDFSKPHKQHSAHNKKSKLIREEPVAVAVAARLQDVPHADESCSMVRSCMSPEAEAAEVVFINSASSSMTDLRDMELLENIHTSTQEINLDVDTKDTHTTNKSETENICLESLTSSETPLSPSPLTTAFIAKIPKQQLPEFCANQNNNNSNKPLINNSKPINNNTFQTSHTQTKTSAVTKTSSLDEADTKLNINFDSDSLLSSLSSVPSSPANDQLVFAQIEEQISSVLSSINEIASQNTNTAIPTTTSSSSSKIHTKFSNTQKLPVTTTSTTVSARTLETSSCEQSFNSSSGNLIAGNNTKTLRAFPQDVNMNTVRDIIINNKVDDMISTIKLNDLKTNSLPTANSCTAIVDPKKLRLLCAETLASFPYGDTVLEELATVAQSIGEARAVKAVDHDKTMPYPLPELPHIDDLQLSLKVGKSDGHKPQLQSPQPDQSWLGVPTIHDPKVLVCLSPSQRTYIQQKPEQKPDDLLDAHQKFVERRGYHEYSKDQLQTLEREKLAEQKLLQTAEIMKKLRKSITPPPPQIPPPPVPVKSSETACKAQNLSKRTSTTTTKTHTEKPNNTINLRAVNDQSPESSNGENDGEENKHRLLSIMQDSSESNASKQKLSLNENYSRQTTNGVTAPVKEQVPLAASTFSDDNLTKSQQFIHFPEHKGTNTMQSVETTLGQMFPSIGSSNIFDKEHKRFSNIESSNAEPFCSQIMNTQPKRYSSIETHSYEAKKRIENGKLVEDFSTSQHETKTSGDKADVFNSFPLKTSLMQENNKINSFLSSGTEQNKSTHHRNDQEIMSALNLNKHSSDIERKQQTVTKSEKTIKTTVKETSHNIASNEHKSADTYEKDLTRKQQQQQQENCIPKSGIQDSYEEFRQRAKAAADFVPTLPSLNSAATAPLTAKVTSNGDNNVESISSTINSSAANTTAITHHHKTTSSHDHEKLFKEFDDLSKQLHKELESSKVEREQREKSTSMFDLNRIPIDKQQIKEFNKSRHEHLKELEHEIERSIRSRSLRLTKPLDVVDHQSGRTYEIPIHIENGSSATPSKSANIHEQAPPIPEHPKTYQIPIQIENSNASYVDDTRFRRAESMFNLSDDIHNRQQTYINQMQYEKAEDDWSKYASDLGSSENITRPIAKEVEICYQRRPAGIRAPRLTASTNDLSFSNQYSYDHCNAYNVKRHHAPMLNSVPEQSRPKFGSCYSMIERDPNPKYISTTTRRGVSPAPQPSGYFLLDGCHVREEDIRQRRASLPRELHEQQLKYITSKEEELRTEFERLQSERRRLMEEAQNTQTPTSPIAPPRSLRDNYRAGQKLPTLTEDEVFRQQMAEEWLHKVAEREKRRLQNIIKISKIHEDDASSRHKADMGEEFLSRVKERRHKLSMPADSDWESGAESQPAIQAQLSEAEDVPSVKIIEGEKEANLRRLPRHLREFAKFSNHQKEAIEGGHREQHQEEERSEETTDNSVSRAFKKSSVVKTVKTLHAPMLPENHGHDTKLHYHNQKTHPTPVRPRDLQVTDRAHRRINKQTRFAVNTNRRSWSESDLLQEIDKDLKLAKGFLFQDVYNVKHEYMSEPETENERPKKMAQLGRRQYDGIGPITNDGMPIILRSEVKEPHQHEWYKRLYQTIHKQKHGEDCVIRYKQLRGRNQYNKLNGYQSEPEPNYDSDYSTIKYRTVNPNRLQSVSSALNIRKSNDTLYGTLPNPVKSGQNSYKNQPGRIEDYTTGHSSVSEKEKKEWWDEIMDIFNVQLDQNKLSSHYTEGNLSRALAKESGYTSDSNLVFRRKEIPQSSPLSPVEQKQAYKNVQAGGEPPLFGFRKPAPEKSKVSPNRYYESDVNIHFKTPVRQEFKYPLSEEELAIRQAEQMQKLYQEERRRKYLQELQDMNSRRHTDNFTPSQKSPIPLNRYDDFPADLAPKISNQVKSVARALYNFQAQNSKELSFKKGDIIYIKRAIDKNWYEGEHNAMIGLFPANYVEIISRESVYPVQPQANVHRKPSEGQARAKYNFQAQSGVELSLNKGELVALTRRVDDNWFEGRIANRKGIFPVSYVEVLTDIGAEDIAARTTTIQQVSVVNARPSLDALRTNINNEFNTLTRNGNQPPNAILRETRNAHKTDILHVDTSSEPLVYRALYKYRPQNSDELELQEGDIIHVLEKCDDGWYVGTSQRTGCFGTFPGNYVERV